MKATIKLKEGDRVTVLKGGNGEINRTGTLKFLRGQTWSVELDNETRFESPGSTQKKLTLAYKKNMELI